MRSNTDDSVSKLMQGYVNIGVKDWDCEENVPDTLEIKAMIFQDLQAIDVEGHKWYVGTGPRIGKDPETGSEYGNVDQFLKGDQNSLSFSGSKPAIIAEIESTPGIITTMTVNTENPYFVEVSDNSDNKAKKEHFNQFFHGFETVMHYRHNYEGVDIIPPNSSVDITIDPLDYDPQWEWLMESTGEFVATPNPLKFKTDA